jgi:hypothetical protein
MDIRSSNAAVHLFCWQRRAVWLERGLKCKDIAATPNSTYFCKALQFWVSAMLLAQKLGFAFAGSVIWPRGVRVQFHIIQIVQ